MTFPSADEITRAMQHPSHVQRGDLYRLHVPALWSELAKVREERDAYLENLTSVQRRCTELLQETRDIPHLIILASRISQAREKHPHGPDLRSLVEEVGEVANAMRRETSLRVVDELLDVACVAMRLVFGEGTL